VLLKSDELFYILSVISMVISWNSLTLNRKVTLPICEKWRLCFVDDYNHDMPFFSMVSSR